MEDRKRQDMKDSKHPLDIQRISKEVKASGLNFFGNSLELKEDAHYPSYPTACDLPYPVTFLLRGCLP